jgi:hypothetical protein
MTFEVEEMRRKAQDAVGEALQVIIEDSEESIRFRVERKDFRPREPHTAFTERGTPYQFSNGEDYVEVEFHNALEACGLYVDPKSVFNKPGHSEVRIPKTGWHRQG